MDMWTTQIQKEKKSVQLLLRKSNHTVLEIGGNPKINAPGIPKSPAERSCNSVHKSKISKN